MLKLLSTLLLLSPAQAADSFELGRNAILGMQGCYLVDYSYTETEGLKPGYERDKRVYDVNGGKSVKEWIYADQISPSRIRLQHVMFAADKEGQLIIGTQLKHTGDDWEFEAPFRYDFVSPSHWVVDSQRATGLWTHRVTNLDDGPRYQCNAEWKVGASGYPEWSCDTYAPIPGRETRDMGRKDYQTLQRSTRIVAYSNNWLERQANIKTIHDSNNVRTPLAKELGKNWYVRLPDSECGPAKEFMAPRLQFWNVLREAWDQVLVGDGPFAEKPYAPGKPSRYMGMLTLEEKYMSRDLASPIVREAAKKELLELIEAFRER
ncbi:MAG TPA: DUF6607 family protein [Bdellovibrionota bacterium]|jgi:hypothetical protein